MQGPIAKLQFARGYLQAASQGASSCFGAYRTRNLKRALPKKLRDKLSKLAANSALTLVDAWCDPNGNRVTIVVDQHGFATTEFAIDHENTQWRVTVRAKASLDADKLLAARKELENRFEIADLGPVVLRQSPDRC